ASLVTRANCWICSTGCSCSTLTGRRRRPGWPPTTRSTRQAGLRLSGGRSAMAAPYSRSRCSGTARSPSMARRRQLWSLTSCLPWWPPPDEGPSWTLHEPPEERPEHQDDADVYCQPRPEVMLEEQDVHADHDGYQREHVQHDGCLSSHRFL